MKKEKKGGVTNTFTADPGTAFSSNEFNEFSSENHVKLILVATGSPQANEQVERVNRMLAPMSGKLFDCKTINNVSRTTGDTPSRLLLCVNQQGDTANDVKEF